MIAAPKNLFRLFMVAPLPDGFFFDHPIGVARMSINHRPRAPDAAQRVALAERCAAEPGPRLLKRKPGSRFCEAALRKSCALHRARDTNSTPSAARSPWRPTPARRRAPAAALP